MTPNDLELLLKREGETLPDEKDNVDVGVERRVALLKDVFEACNTAKDTASPDLEILAEKLGDGSRTVNWRKPYGESGILTFFLDILGEDSSSTTLKTQALRISGNSCADTDSNRARVVDGNKLSNITKQLDDLNLVKFAVPVLYNIMVDYEPAQKLASESGLSARLLKLLSASTIKSYMPVVPYICKILALVVGQQPSPSSASEEDSQAANVLLKLALGPETRDDGEEFSSVVSVALAYLATEDESKAHPIADSELDLFLDAFYHAQTNFTIEEEEEDSAEALKQLNTSLMNVLADITSQDSFSESHNLESAVSQKFLAWLRHDLPMLRAAACLALGNLSRSDEASTALVSKYNAHEALVDILTNPSTRDGQLLHASMSFLKNLAIPAQNKSKLSGLLEPNGLPCIYALDAVPQVQFAAISLTRLLLLNCADNIAKMCRRGENGETPLETAIALFGRSDAEPTKMEAARSAGTICRGLHSLPVEDMLSGSPAAEDNKDLVESIASSGNEDSLLRHAFYQTHTGIIKLLAFLITQDKWPVLRSEAWFVFALMARTADGALVVADVLKQDGALTVLNTTITGRKPSSETVQDVTEETDGENKGELATPQSLGLEPQQVPAGPKADTGPVDRENALVMCTELENNWNKEEFVGLDKSEIQTLVKEGTELVAAYKAKQ